MEVGALAEADLAAAATEAAATEAAAGSAAVGLVAAGWGLAWELSTGLHTSCRLLRRTSTW